MGHMRITRRSDETATKLITNGSIEASGDSLLLAPYHCRGLALTNHQVWVEIICDRHDHLLESIEIVRITHSFGGPGYIDISIRR